MKIDLSNEELSCIYATLNEQVEKIKIYYKLLGRNANRKFETEDLLIKNLTNRLHKILENSK